MTNLHTVIVPGVGGSDDQHWQSWLEKSLPLSSRVVQEDWNSPILNQWVDKLYHHLNSIKQPIQVVAHSFGCLTAIAALNQYPILRHKLDSLILVAPANPARFSEVGFATLTDNYVDLFKQFTLNIPTLMVVSENDPWLAYQDAVRYAKHWNIPFINQGMAGHINVASGFGAWPQIFNYMQSVHLQHDLIEQQYFQNHQHFRFAI